MELLPFTCAYCGKPTAKPVGAVTRAQKIGARLYCDKACAALGRRKNKTKAQKVEEKRLYDIRYREREVEMLKIKKAARYQLIRDPAKEAIYRKLNMPRHVEYCRRPEYVAWKQEYDRQLRAKQYGEFAECHLLLLDLDREVNSRMSDYDVRMANGILNKKLQRRRAYGRLDSN